MLALQNSVEAFVRITATNTADDSLIPGQTHVPGTHDYPEDPVRTVPSRGTLSPQVFLTPGHIIHLSQDSPSREQSTKSLKKH